MRREKEKPSVSVYFEDQIWIGCGFDLKSLFQNVLLLNRKYLCEWMKLPNSPGNSCWASSTRRSVHQRSCDDVADPNGDVVPDAECCCESRMADLLLCVIFEFQSDCGGELGKWWYTAVGPVGRCIWDVIFFGAILAIF